MKSVLFFLLCTFQSGFQTPQFCSTFPFCPPAGGGGFPFNSPNPLAPGFPFNNPASNNHNQKINPQPTNPQPFSPINQQSLNPLQPFGSGFPFNNPASGSGFFNNNNNYNPQPTNPRPTNPRPTNPQPINKGSCPRPRTSQRPCPSSSSCSLLIHCTHSSSPSPCALPSGEPGVCCPAPRHHALPALPRAINAPCSPAARPLSYSCSGSWRSLNGSCNNWRSPYQGAQGEPYVRLLPPQYGAGGSPRGGRRSSLPSARHVSHSLMSGSLGGGRMEGLSEHLMQWGQFLAHDLVSTPKHALDCCGADRDSENCAPIAVARNDPVYGPRGVTCLGFERSLMVCGQEQQNTATAYLDCSQMYGPKGETARSHFHGLLKDEALEIELEAQPPGPGPPCNTNTQKHCFISGDGRINMTPGLAMTHALWHREHNRLAKLLRKTTGEEDDEVLFQKARAIVMAEVQVITYNEYLPLLLGPTLAASLASLPYSSNVNGAISTEFASAAFRFGHSMVPNTVSLFTTSCPRKKVDVERLKDNMFNPDILHKEGNIDELAAGQGTSPAPSPGPNISPALRGGLFAHDTGNTDGGHDLASRNIQRARDHGVAGYAAYRSLCSHTRVSSFSHLEDVMSPAVLSALASTYRHVEDVDLWVGGLLETPVAGALVGPTFSCILAEQFARIKQGDLYFHTFPDAGLTPRQQEAMSKFSMARLLCDNSKVGFVQPLAFRLASAWNPLVACDSQAIPAIDLGLWA